MKKVIVVMLVVVLWSTSAFAFDPMGPPAAGLKQGQYSIGTEYMRGEMDVDADGITLGGVVFGSDEIKNTTFNKLYTKLAYGLNDDTELFLRLGAADADLDKSSNRNNLASYIGDSDFEFAVGCGAKITLSESDDGKEKWGILTQISWVELDLDDKTYTIGAFSGTIGSEIELLEIQIALGPTYEITDTISIYGGPFLHFIDGEADVKAIVNGTPYHDSSDLEQSSIFGGYIGAEIKLAENVNCNIEFQGTGGGYALGTSLIWKF